MAGKGRAQWSDRIVVENCLSFDISQLVRSGVFLAKPRTLCSTSWNNAGGQEIFRALFWWEVTASGRMLLHMTYGVPSNVPLMHYGQSQTIEIVQTQLQFGPRSLFLCPGVHLGAPCRQRVRILYLPPKAHRLGCRKCFDLIYRSAREHDARIDKLLQLSPEEFRRVLIYGSTQEQFLAIRASNRRYLKLVKNAARYDKFVSERQARRANAALTRSLKRKNTTPTVP